MLQFNKCEKFESEVGIIPITENIYFFCGILESKFWNERTRFGIVKNGEFRTVNVRKDIYVSLNNNFDKENVEEAVENGDAIKFSSDELVEIAKEIGYLVPVSEESIRKVVSWFVYGRGEDYEYCMEWGNKIKKILTDEEKSNFREWEESVGYSDEEYELFGRKRTIRKYNCEEPELEGALYMTMRSERLLNSVIFLMNGITDHDLSLVWNYLVSYKYRDSFVETMHFSDWEDNDPDTLKEKYGIGDKKVEYEDNSFIRRNDASVYEGDKYKMSIQICAGFDDWDGFAVVVKNDCKYSPLELINAGESLHWIENNFHVKTKLVVRS